MSFTKIAKEIGKGALWVAKGVGNEMIKQGTGIDFMEESAKAKRDSERYGTTYVQEMADRMGTVPSQLQENEQDKVEEYIRKISDEQLMKNYRNDSLNDMARKVVNAEVSRRHL